MEKVNTEKKDKLLIFFKMLFGIEKTPEEEWEQLSESDRALLEKTLKSVDAKAPKTGPKQSKKKKKELTEISEPIKNGDRQVKKGPKLNETKTNETLLDREKEI